MRRVVVTGLGAVTPLGIGLNLCSECFCKGLLYTGVKRTWSRLLDAQCGIVSLKTRSNYDLEQQQCHVAGLVPENAWNNAVKQHFTEEVGSSFT